MSEFFQAAETAAPDTWRHALLSYLDQLEERHLHITSDQLFALYAARDPNTADLIIPVKEKLEECQLCDVRARAFERKSTA